MSHDTSKVFVVHGRNIKAKDALFAFLRTIGLRPIEWSEALSCSGKGSPYIGDILENAYKAAQAVIVLLTGDDFAYLNPYFCTSDDEKYEKEPTPQARPNVLFEAGLAFGSHPDRTVLVQVGNVRPFSDIAGRHVVKLTNDPVRRHELVVKLKNAGCVIDIESKTDWMKEGDFDQVGQLPELITSTNVLENYPYHSLLYSVNREATIDYENLRLLILGKMSMKIRSNCEDLSKVNHSIGSGNNKAVSLLRASIKPIETEFSRSSRGVINFEEKRITESTVNWELTFHPRLEKDELVEYAVEWKYHKGFLCHEEFANAKANGIIPIDREYEVLERTTAVPCDRLISMIIFPAGYNIIDPNIIAKKKSIPITKEMERIKENKYFTVEPPIGNVGWRLTLDMPCPIISVSYVIQWKPPQLGNMLKNGLITIEQRDIIIDRIRISADASDKEPNAQLAPRPA